jgi:hypothetical protein
LKERFKVSSFILLSAIAIIILGLVSLVSGKSRDGQSFPMLLILQGLLIACAIGGVGAEQNSTTRLCSLVIAVLMILHAIPGPDSKQETPSETGDHSP